MLVHAGYCTNADAQPRLQQYLAASTLLPTARQALQQRLASATTTATNAVLHLLQQSVA